MIIPLPLIIIFSYVVNLTKTNAMLMFMFYAIAFLWFEIFAYVIERMVGIPYGTYWYDLLELSIAFFVYALNVHFITTIMRDVITANLSEVCDCENCKKERGE